MNGKNRFDIRTEMAYNEKICVYVRRICYGTF